MAGAPRAPAAVVAALAAALAVAACSGGTPSPASQARATVERFYSDLERGRGAAACSLLTTAAQEAVARPLLAFAKEHKLGCERVLGSYSRAMAHNPADLREMKATTFGSVSVIGGRAMVVVGVPHVGLRAAPLTHTRDGWRISQFSVSTRKPISG